MKKNFRYLLFVIILFSCSCTSVDDDNREIISRYATGVERTLLPGKMPGHFAVGMRLHGKYHGHLAREEV